MNNSQGADIIFRLEHNQIVYAHKSLILFRSIEREIRLDLNEDQSIAKLMKSKQIPEFFRQIYNLLPGQSLYL